MNRILLTLLVLWVAATPLTAAPKTGFIRVRISIYKRFAARFNTLDIEFSRDPQAGPAAFKLVRGQETCSTGSLASDRAQSIINDWVALASQANAAQQETEKTDTTVVVTVRNGKEVEEYRRVFREDQTDGIRNLLRATFSRESALDAPRRKVTDDPRPLWPRDYPQREHKTN